MKKWRQQRCAREHGQSRRVHTGHGQGTARKTNSKRPRKRQRLAATRIPARRAKLALRRPRQRAPGIWGAREEHCSWLPIARRQRASDRTCRPTPHLLFEGVLRVSRQLRQAPPATNPPPPGWAPRWKHQLMTARSGRTLRGARGRDHPFLQGNPHPGGKKLEWSGLQRVLGEKGGEGRRVGGGKGGGSGVRRAV